MEYISNAKICLILQFLHLNLFEPCLFRTGNKSVGDFEAASLFGFTAAAPYWGLAGRKERETKQPRSQAIGHPALTKLGTRRKIPKTSNTLSATISSVRCKKTRDKMVLLQVVWKECFKHCVQDWSITKNCNNLQSTLEAMRLEGG